LALISAPSCISFPISSTLGFPSASNVRNNWRQQQREVAAPKLNRNKRAMCVRSLQVRIKREREIWIEPYVVLYFWWWRERWLTRKREMEVNRQREIESERYHSAWYWEDKTRPFVVPNILDSDLRREGERASTFDVSNVEIREPDWWAGLDVLERPDKTEETSSDKVVTKI
jgi:hypothetical protein